MNFSKRVWFLINQISKYLIITKSSLNEERERMFMLSMVSTFLSKSISFIVVIISVPLTLQYLGTAYFAILNTIISTLSMLNYLDFGLGVGVQNLLPSYIAQNKTDDVNRIISTAFYILVFSCFLVLTVGLFFVHYYKWDDIIRLGNSVNILEVKNALIVTVILIAIAIPISLIQRIQISYQRMFINEWFITLGNVLSILGLYFIVKFDLGLTYVILVMQGFIVFSTFLNFIIHFQNPKYFKIRLNFFNFKLSRFLFLNGIKYLLLLVFSVGLFSLDNFILLRYRPTLDVTKYSIGYRLITILNIPILILTNSFLPALNDAIARNAKIWVREKILKSVIFILIISLFSMFFLLIFGKVLIRFWINSNIEFSNEDIFLLSLLLVFFNFNVFVSMIALTPRYLNHTILLFPIAVFITVLFKFLLTKYISSGFIPVIVPTILVMSIFFILPLSYRIYKNDLSQ
jgi:O-antigen/teichoic acid export membrane protein